MTFQRLAYLSLRYAPIGILVGWAGMRLGGGGGDEPLWTSSHLVWLPSYAALAFGYIGVHALIRPERAAGKALAGFGVALAAIGGLAVAAQMVVDLGVGFGSSNATEMSELSDRIQGVPGVEAAVYEVGPLLLFVGMLILTIHAAARRRIPAYAAVLVVAAVVVSGLEQAVDVPLRLMMAAAVVLLWFAAQPIAARMRQRELVTA
jgi:hypothetical protein